MAMPELSVQALALTIRYLKQFGFERILCLSASFRPLNANFEMKLSLNALQQLEVCLHYILNYNKHISNLSFFLVVYTHTKISY